MSAVGWLTGLIVLLAAAPVFAHEMRPGYLDVREVAPDRYDVLWKQPAIGDMRLRLDPVFPPSCAAADRIRRQVPGAYVDRMTITCDSGLPGKPIAVAGLEATMTDVLVRLELADGRALTAILKPSRPAFTVPRSGHSAGTLSYLRLGVEHILLGVDHLLFVLGLVLLVGPRRLLLTTITAFTVGHSISLALATLGVVSVPGPPLEAAIALSIVFLAADVLRARRGQRHLTARYPWVIAGAFGLLHGLGFATALTDRRLRESWGRDHGAHQRRREPPSWVISMSSRGSLLLIISAAPTAARRTRRPRRSPWRRSGVASTHGREHRSSVQRSGFPRRPSRSR